MAPAALAFVPSLDAVPMTIEPTTAKPPGQSSREARKATAASVHQARQRLTQGDGKPEFEYELLNLFVRNELGATFTIPCLATIVAMASMFWSPPQETIAWLIVLFGARAVLLTSCKRFARTPRDNIKPKDWRRRLTAAELIYGTAWAGMALVGFSPSESSAHIFVFAVLIVVLSLRLLFASTVMAIVYAGTVPMTIALVARFALQDNPLYWAMAAMAIGIHIYFIFLAKGLNATVCTMLEYRAEKDALIAQLEEAKAISDEARRRAEASNMAKSRFLANMSHELRTPLNAVLGFSEVMKTEIMGPMQSPIYKEYAENIHQSGTHLLHVINEILDLSRIEAGRHQLHEEALHLVDVAEECHRLLKLRAENKQQKILHEFADGLPQIWADEQAMRQILLNLMSNALKFTPPNGTITLRVALKPDGGQMLSVKDTGPGIPKEELPRVMQAFGQGSLAHRAAEGGTGLGLSIVKSLVELHGGVFELKSELRKGTEAIVNLPKERSLAPVQPLQPLGEERHRRRSPSPAGDDDWLIAPPPSQPRRNIRAFLGQQRN